MNQSDLATVHEEGFLRSFIRRESRDRFRHELSKNRSRFIGRFSHTARTYLDPRHISALDLPKSDPLLILELLREKGAPDLCYAFATRDSDAGELLPLEKCLVDLMGLGSPSIISCLPGSLAYLETEQSHGPPDRFILFLR